MNNLYAIYAAFRQQWKVEMSSKINIFALLTSVPGAIILAWIVRQSGDQDVITYVIVGVFFVSIWRGIVFQIGWSIHNELSGGTLDFSLISRTPLIALIFGKSLAEVLYRARSGLIASIIILLMAGKPPDAANIPLLICSLVFVVISISITGLLFAPLFVLARGRGGFWNAIIPFTTVLGCFLIPIVQLPTGLAVAARFIPASWAMESVWFSIVGAKWWIILRAWGMCLLTTAFVFTISYLMLRIVEKRIKMTGSLGVS